MLAKSEPDCSITLFGSGGNFAAASAPRAVSSAHSIWGFETTFTFCGLPCAAELECTFHGHAMNPFRMLHQLCKHHSTSDVSGLNCIRSPDGIAVCRARMRWPEQHRRDDK